MKKFEISDVGYVELYNSQIYCNINIKPRQFTRKFIKHIIKLPNSLINAIKKAIKEKNNPVKFNPIYFKTLENFFLKIQMEALKKQNVHTQKKKHQRKGKIINISTSIEDILSDIAKNEFNSFLSKKASDTFLSHRKIIGKDYGNRKNVNFNNKLNSSYFPELTNVISLIEQENLLDAKKNLVDIIKQSDIIDIAEPIKKRLIVCKNSIDILEKKNLYWELFKKGQIQDSLIKFSKLKNNITKLGNNFELYSYLANKINNLYSKILKERDFKKNYIISSLNKATNLIQHQKYLKADEILSKIQLLAQQIKSEILLKKIISIKENIGIEFKISKALIKFQENEYSRIHISEITEKTGIKTEDVEKKIKELISKGAIEAEFDEKSGGIIFKYLQKEIDSLLEKFKEWENQGKSKGKGKP